MKGRTLRSLRSSQSFRQFVLDQLEPLEVRARAMFGGTGLYSSDCFFGIIARDRLFLKVDDTTRDRYRRHAGIAETQYRGTTARRQRR